MTIASFSLSHGSDFRVAVMGAGMVGGALARYLSEQERVSVELYDPLKGMNDLGALARADAVFVAVPTPYYMDGAGFDDSYLHAAFSVIPGSKTVVIKSTVLPGTTERFQRRYSRHRILFNPEFLSEATADHDMRHPTRQIIGHTAASAAVAEQMLALLPKAPFMATVSATEAEMVKYMNNAFYGLKVTFANQIYDLCERLGLEYEEVARCATPEPMMGASHWRVVHKGYRGYGGKCLPKDVRALIQLAYQHGLKPSLLEAAEAYNNRLVRSQGLDIRWKEGSPDKGNSLFRRLRDLVAKAISSGGDGDAPPLHP